VARARQKGCTLLVTGGDWQGAATRLEARVCGYEVSGPGRPGIGRISKVRLAMRARGRSFGAGAAVPATGGTTRLRGTGSVRAVGG